MTQGLPRGARLTRRAWSLVVGGACLPVVGRLLGVRELTSLGLVALVLTGASLALVDRPTVILEMDLRKPRLHQVMNMANTVGLSNYLIQEAPLDAVLQDVPGLPNYHIITSGPIPPNPAELLSSPQLGQLFAELRTRFDYIIVDSPPIGLVTDAQLIAPHADATLFMVRHDHTPKAYLTMIDGLYRDNRFNRLNLILNGVGHSESFQYGYAYGGYYETTSKPEKRTLRRLRT